MIRLDTTTRKLQVILAGAVATTQLPVVCSWSDATSTTYTGGSTPTSSNNTTAVDIVAAPGASTVREVDNVNIYNADTASVTVTVRLNDNATLYPLQKVTLLTGESMVYTHAGGWIALDVNGNRKEVTSSVFSSLTVTGNETVGGTFGVTGTTTVAAITASGTATHQALTDISGASAGQIKFPATQNPSADANTLDDYEEGTWVPVDASGAGLTFTSVTANYTKIGRIVIINCVLTYPSTANASAMAISGLPFSSPIFAPGAISSNSGLTMISRAAAGTGTVLFVVASTDGTATNAQLTLSTNRFSLIFQI